MSILIIVEHDDNHIKPATLSTIAAGLEIVKKNNSESKVALLIAGYNNKFIANLENLKVNKIIVADNPTYQHQLAEDLTQLILKVVKDSDYEYILFPATTFGKNIAPRVAALLDINPLSEVLEIISQDTFKRPIYAGNAIATVKLKDKIKLLTIRTTSFDYNKSENNAVNNVKPEIINIIDTATTTGTNKSEFIKDEFSESKRPELVAAKTVVSGGRALQSKENFELIEKLADVLNAAVGASRAAVDAGYVPNDYQVGQTGKVVAPDLYIAVGISGAIQHVAGMQNSKVIVAINKDSEAPIFKIADYSLVGDLFAIVPELTDKIAKLKQKL